MDNRRPQWCNWCRLCAKEAPENNVSIHFRGIYQPLTVSEDVKEALDKYFSVKTSNEIQLPTILCGDCHSFISSLLEFSERVRRVQQMYAHLMQADSSSDLRAVRLKYDVFDDYREHGFTQDAMTEVVSCQDSQEDCLSAFIIKQESFDTKLIEYDEEPLECDDPVDENDPFETMTDFNAYKSGSSISGKETSKARSNRRNRKIKTDKDPDWQRDEKNPSDYNDNDQSDTMADEELLEPLQTRAKGKMRKQTVKREPQQVDEKTHESNRSDSVSEEEAMLNKVTRKKRNKQRDTNRKKKDEVRIDYTMDAACAVCEEKFYLFSTYCEHMLASHVNHEWKCVSCNRPLQSRHDFERHLRKHLPKKSIIKHICTICGLELSCSTTLKRHLSVHSDKMQHLCDHCGRAFKRNTTLKAHMILHTGLKPYACNFCELTFACQSNCRRHMRKAHAVGFAALQTFGNKSQTKN